MKRINIRHYLGASLMLAAFVALVAIAQQPAMTPEPAWYWSDFFGQRVQVYGRQLADGRIAWQPEDVGRYVAPAEMERRAGVQRPNQPAPGASLNYGILVDALANEQRKIRASDPGTLQEVKAALEDEEDVERKPGIIERAEMDVERAILYGVVACLAVASLVLVVKSNRSYPP